MSDLSSPYLEKKEISLSDLQAVTRSTIEVREGTVVLFDEDGEDSGERHRGNFLFRELVGFSGESLGYERVLDEKVVRQPGQKPNDKFTTTGTNTDSFTPFGDAWDQGIMNIDSQIIVCAGIAEGYRLHEATGLPVACCVGEQKIAKLVSLMRSVTRYPNQVIAAVDNDKAGYIAALRSGVDYLMPSSDKDFSDVYQHQGGIEAVREETSTPIPAPDHDTREAELDRLLGRTPNDSPTADPLAMADDRFYRERQHTSELEEKPEPKPSSELMLVETDIVELGFSGGLQVAHEDQRKISGYSHFKTMAEALDIDVFEEENSDQWLMINAESMTLLAAMMPEGLEDVLDEVPDSFTTLKSHIFAAIKDGMLDLADLPGGAPALISLEESGAGPFLKLQTDYDPEIRKMCLRAGGRFDKSDKAWHFLTNDSEALNKTIRVLADNPLRRMVFMLPEESEAKWLIGTPERIEPLQTMFAEAAGFAPLQRPTREAGQEAGASDAAPTDDLNAILGGGSVDDLLEEEEESYSTPEAPDTKASVGDDTLAKARLTTEDGKPHLVLKSPYNKTVVSVCRQVKRKLEAAYPDHPRATFNKNESGAWHYPVPHQEALELALEALCEADCDEIGIATPNGNMAATVSNHDALLAAMAGKLSPASKDKDGPGKPEGSPAEKSPDAGALESKPTTTPESKPGPKPQQPESESAKASPTPRSVEDASGMVYLEGRGDKRELVLKTEFDRQVVAACKRVKGEMDRAHSDQPKASFNRHDDKAWRFSVRSDTALANTIAAICHENLPQLAFHCRYGKALATPDNHMKVSDWLHREADSAREASPSERPQKATADERNTGSESARPDRDSRQQTRGTDQKEPENQAKDKPRAQVTFHIKGRCDFLRMTLDQYDPEIIAVCKQAYGEFKRRDRTWHFPVFSSTELKKTLEELCSNDLGRIDMVMSDQGDTITASPESLNKIIRGYNAVRTSAKNIDTPYQDRGSPAETLRMGRTDGPGM